jgi:hypothetical protein
MNREKLASSVEELKVEFPQLDNEALAVVREERVYRVLEMWKTETRVRNSENLLKTWELLETSLNRSTKLLKRQETRIRELEIEIRYLERQLETQKIFRSLDGLMVEAEANAKVRKAKRGLI